MQLAGLGQQPGQRREHRPIRPGPPRPPDLAAEHGDLVTQHQNLHVLRPGTTGQQAQPCHELPEDQIKQSYRHGRRSCPAATLKRCRRSSLWMSYSAPTGCWSGPRPGEGVELVRARQLLGVGCIPIGVTLVGGGYLFAARPEKGLQGVMSHMRVSCPLSGVQPVSSGGEPVIEMQLMTTDPRS